MVTFGWGSGSIRGHGNLSFNESITVVDPDGTVYHRQMNPDGGFYDAVEELYYEDDGSLRLSESGSDGSLHLGESGDGAGEDDGFLDALQHHLNMEESDDGPLALPDDDDGDMGHYFQGAK